LPLPRRRGDAEIRMRPAYERNSEQCGAQPVNVDHRDTRISTAALETMRGGPASLPHIKSAQHQFATSEDMETLMLRPVQRPAR
jgi:hypothetical protein